MHPHNKNVKENTIPISFENLNTICPFYFVLNEQNNFLETGNSFKKLLKKFNSISFLKYPMGHEVCEKEIDDLSIFLNQSFN